MAESPAVIKAGINSAFRDYVVDGLPSSGDHEPVKAEIRSSFVPLVDLAEEARELAATAGTTIVATTRAQLIDMPGPFSTGDRGEVRADPAGNVTNGNGIYRYSGSAWVWIDQLIPPSIQQVITDNAVEETGAQTDAKVMVLRQEVAELITPSEYPLLNLGDEFGFSIPFLTPDALVLREQSDILAKGFSILGEEGDGFIVADELGFVGFVASSDPPPLPETLESRQLKIIVVDGVTFAIGDEFGFFPVYVPDGRSLGPTDVLTERVAALEERPIGAAWPRIQHSRAEIVAHRGAWWSVAPENSIDSLRIAARMGYRIAEADVLRTSDGHFVLMHDNSINRTMRNASDYSAIEGTVNVASNTLADLRAGYVLLADDPAMRRPIPTLAEYLAECKAIGVKPMVEIKNTSFGTAVLDELVEQCVAVMGWDGVCFCSFSATQLDYIGTIGPQIDLYYIMTFNSTNIAHVSAKGGIFYCAYAQVTSELVTEAHQAGVPVACWTVPRVNFDQLAAMGVDAMAGDALAPTLREQTLAFGIQSGPDWTGWTTNGTTTGGVVTLTSGQTLTLTPGQVTSVELAGWYLALEFSGDLTVAGVGMTASRSHSVMASRVFQSRFSGVATLTLTAGASGAIIKTSAFAVARY